jgi:hypothetical protein
VEDLARPLTACGPPAASSSALAGCAVPRRNDFRGNMKQILDDTETLCAPSVDSLEDLQTSGVYKSTYCT